MSDAPPWAESGFTLLEIIVAMVVAGLIFAGLGQAFGFGVQAWVTQNRMVATGDLDATDRALRGLIERMDPVADNGAPALTGARSELAFVSTLPEGVGGEAAIRRAAMRLSVRDGRLQLAWTPAPNGLPLRPAPRVVTPLLDGVAGLDVAYWRPATAGVPAAWLSSWNEPRPPSLVRLRLRFAPADPRHWPDLVASPRREAPQ